MKTKHVISVVLMYPFILIGMVGAFIFLAIAVGWRIMGNWLNKIVNES